MYIWIHATRDEKLRWIFNLFDMDADEKLCKKEFKKIELALIQARASYVSIFVVINVTPCWLVARYPLDIFCFGCGVLRVSTCLF